MVMWGNGVVICALKRSSGRAPPPPGPRHGLCRHLSNAGGAHSFVYTYTACLLPASRLDRCRRCCAGGQKKENRRRAMYGHGNGKGQEKVASRRRAFRLLAPNFFLLLPRSLLRPPFLFLVYHHVVSLSLYFPYLLSHPQRHHTTLPPTNPPPQTPHSHP